MRLAEPAAQATKQTTDGIGETITQYLTAVFHSAYCRARRVEDRDRRLFSQFYATGFSQFVVSLYNSGFHVGSCTVVAISRCNIVPVAPALPSQGPGLCAVPARGALAIPEGSQWFCPTPPLAEMSHFGGHTTSRGQRQITSVTSPRTRHPASATPLLLLLQLHPVAGRNRH